MWMSFSISSVWPRSITCAASSTPKLPSLTVTAVVATLLSLVLAGFCFFMASLITYGLYSWTEPKLDPAIILPLVGIGLLLPVGPLVMSLGPRRSFWLRFALIVSLGGIVLASLTTWVPVALDR